MPVHDWNRVHPGIFHDFHHEWISVTRRELNRILHGSDYYALAEQVVSGFGPDVLTLKLPTNEPVVPVARNSSLSVMVAPQSKIAIQSAPGWYTSRKKSVVVRHVSDHSIVAVLEIVSPGNKTSQRAISAITSKIQSLLTNRIHVSFVDVFPPTALAPQGLHPIVWEDAGGDCFAFDPTQPLLSAAYVAVEYRAYLDPFAIGESLPSLPVFLTPFEHITVDMETTYRVAFEAVADVWQQVLIG